MEKDKIEEKKIERLERWSRGEELGPVEAEIFPTNKCNLNCKYCSVPEDESESLTPEVLRKTVAKLLEMGVKEFSFSGGEPFLMKNDLLKVMEKIKQKKSYGRIITNGTVWNQTTAKKLVEIGWDEIQISIDGPDADTNDFTRGRGTFKKIKTLVEEFEKYKNKSRKGKPLLTANMVLHNKNWDKIIEMVEFVKETPFQNLQIQALFHDTQYSKKLKMGETEQQKFEDKISSALEALNGSSITTNLGEFKKPEFIEESDDISHLLNKSTQGKEDKFLKIPCYQPWYRMAIKEDGKTGPCSILAEKSDINIYNKNLKEIWRNEYKKIRKGMLEDEMAKECEKCCSENIFKNEDLRNELRRRIN